MSEKITADELVSEELTNVACIQLCYVAGGSGGWSMVLHASGAEHNGRRHIESYGNGGSDGSAQ
jgi:hypothetical protein